MIVGAWTVARPTFPKLASLRPAVAKGNTVLDEALALLHLQALGGLQSCIDILAGGRKALAEYPGVVGSLCCGASSMRSHDERRVADQHDSAKDRPGDGHVNDCLHEWIPCRGNQLGEFGMDLSLCARSQFADGI